ncbi:hypothetical protein [Rhodoferax sp.]|uniref:hypothetical protein n=1 Tax=Rhodoferax sp. TaxID=50421 RepID=UPI0025DDB74B|nr:hypothetical protein [Rhodoferax sp.]
MRKFCLPVLFLIVGVAFTWRVQAQPIYRCGNTYSQLPCPGALPMDLSDARQPEQKTQTQAAALTDARLAKTMEQDRLAEEKRLLAANQAPPEQPKRVDASKEQKTSGAEIAESGKKKVPKKKSRKKGKKPA